MTHATSLPINVMCMPDLPPFDTLKEVGVKRISMGNFMHEAIIRSLKEVSGKVMEEQSFKVLFGK